MLEIILLCLGIIGLLTFKVAQHTKYQRFFVRQPLRIRNILISIPFILILLAGFVFYIRNEKSNKTDKEIKIYKEIKESDNVDYPKNMPTNDLPAYEIIKDQTVNGVTRHIVYVLEKDNDRIEKLARKLAIDYQVVNKQSFYIDIFTNRKIGLDYFDLINSKDSNLELKEELNKQYISSLYSSNNGKIKYVELN